MYRTFVFAFLAGLFSIQCATADTRLVDEIGSPDANIGLSCTKDVISADDRDHIEILTDVKARHRDMLFAIPGVIGVGVGFVFKDGERTEEVAILVYTNKELPPEQVDPMGVIPTELEGCKVSVREIGPLQPARLLLRSKKIKI